NRGTRFINATEGGILNESAEILSLKDALHQRCKKPVRLPLGEARSASPIGRSLKESSEKPRRVRVAVEHLHEVLKTRSTTCSCLHGFLDLTAKKHVLENNTEGLDSSI